MSHPFLTWFSNTAILAICTFPFQVFSSIQLAVVVCILVIFIVTRGLITDAFPAPMVSTFFYHFSKKLINFYLSLSQSLYQGSSRNFATLGICRWLLTCEDQVWAWMNLDDYSLTIHFFPLDNTACSGMRSAIDSITKGRQGWGRYSRSAEIIELTFLE